MNEKIINYINKKSALDAFNDLTELMGFTDTEASNILGVKIFDDLNFEPHSVIPNAVASSMYFDGNVGEEWISIVGGGAGLYGNGVDTFEVWSHILPDPLSYLNKKEVTQEMLKLQKSKYEL